MIWYDMIRPEGKYDQSEAWIKVSKKCVINDLYEEYLFAILLHMTHLLHRYETYFLKFVNFVLLWII